MKIYRSEYPKPQFERLDWMNLNGEWQFEIDNGLSGKERGLYEKESKLSGKITVPFCPESILSGVHHLDFMAGVWYKRTVLLPEEKLKGRTILHFGAVDYLCTVYVNGFEAGYHRGGYASFSFDITEFATTGENQITVYAVDDVRNPMTPRGKQCEKYYSCRCDYTRTTGIWQTVWLEFKPDEFIENIKFYPNIDEPSVTLETTLCGVQDLCVTVLYDGRIVAEKQIFRAAGTEVFSLMLAEKHLWEPGHGRLYDVRLTFGEDCVKSYFGLRSVRLDKMRFLINEKSVFQRLVLDQGFYPDGIYTAPSDAALVRDIELSLAMGFNGARLHQKVFEERFLYHCDRMGYLVWGEYGNWGLDHTRKESVYSILPEWGEVVRRDFNHPAIIGWCPYNETWNVDGRRQVNESIKMVYDFTKSVDVTRPCIDTSGNFHVKTDIYDVHDYEQNPEKFAAHYEKLLTDGTVEERQSARQTYRGGPFFVSEYGGIKWAKDKSGWGYGNAPQTEEEFIERFRGLACALLSNSGIFGLCYTQLTDVEQEQNGLYTYGRKPKFPPEIFRDILSQKAAIEQEDDGATFE